VPLITPVEVSITSPDGRLGEIAKEIGEVPPLKLTGVNGVTDEFL
jgi:hypothetical protein